MWPVRLLAQLIAPPLCAACGAATGPPVILCPACRSALGSGPPLVGQGPPGTDLAVSACPFERVGRSVVHGLKYGGRLRLADVAAAAIVQACPAGELRGALVPVPASPWRWRWRGFDPAEEIALALARLTGIAYTPILRRDHGPRQVGRTRSSRLGEPPRVRARGVAPERALLVDDVRTTGATLAACATALRAAGTAEVLALTFAYVS